MLCCGSYGLPRRFAPRNDSGGTYLHPLTRLCLQHVIANHVPAPAHTSFLQHVIANQCAHWCGNPHPRRETWQVGSTSGEFVTPYEFARSTTFCHALPQEYGLPRRFAPRNDMQKLAACPRLQLRATSQTRSRLRIRLKCCFSFCAAAGEADCHVASLLAMTMGGRTCTRAHVFPSACHCEPVRTLVRQSVFPAGKPGK